MIESGLVDRELNSRSTGLGFDSHCWPCAELSDKPHFYCLRLVTSDGCLWEQKKLHCKDWRKLQENLQILNCLRGDETVKECVPNTECVKKFVKSAKQGDIRTIKGTSIKGAKSIFYLM